MAATAKDVAYVRDQITARREKVLSLRLTGVSVRRIAAEMQVSKRTIEKDLDAVLGKLAKRTDGYAKQWRALQKERLEQAILKIHQEMRPYNPKDPNDKPNRKPLDFETGMRLLLQYIDREIKLDGLDAPMKIDIGEANQVVQLILSRGGDPSLIFKIVLEMLMVPGQNLGLLAGGATDESEDGTDEEAEDYVDAEVIEDHAD